MQGYRSRRVAFPFVVGLLLAGLAACSSGGPAASRGGAPVVPPPTTGTLPTPGSIANSPNPCTLASAGELTSATGVEFVDGVAGTIPGAGPSCEWNLVPKEPTIDTHSGYVLINFMPYGLDKARIVDAGKDTTVAGRAAIIGSGDSNGVASIDAGGGTVLRVEMTLGPQVREFYEVLTSDIIDDVAAVAAGHL